jgi:hypothetical protein
MQAHFGTSLRPVRITRTPPTYKAAGTHARSLTIGNYGPGSMPASNDRPLVHFAALALGCIACAPFSNAFAVPAPADVLQTALLILLMASVWSCNSATGRSPHSFRRRRC